MAPDFIGEWLRARGCRDQIILATKGAHPPFQDMHAGRLDRASIQSDLAASLEALGVENVDVYYLHRDDESRPVGEILETLNGFVEEGRVKLLGASNWKTARLREANAYAAAHGLKGFAANQPKWSLARCLLETDDTLVQMDGEMARWHRETGAVCTPYTSQAKGYFMKLQAGTLSEKARERYDAQRTLRRQGNAYLTAGSVLYSNLGHPLMTIVADTCGRHDTLGGACAQESNTVRYALDKRYMHSCRDNFLCACLHDGRLHKRDIGANINFFMNVPVTPEGGLTFEDGISAAGKYVELRAECNAMVLISNCPQLNNPCNGWNPTPAEVLVWN